MVYQTKGGIWKNTEDEILKAAVMKYGLNQWARISSLLVRKSASQCKARWYEWLDPSIKKTEWSREEEEKLLHLAKLLPNQWRTIAPLVGRTANQCLEHYEKLLDAAQQKDGGDQYLGLDDPRRPRAGEIDPSPETKPARPDPIDMDEDEKEMLQEARARLANTRGKKAKRKMREKQLEEARRIAALQKRRELKAAGINFAPKVKKNTKTIDYGKEIPFLQVAPAGFFEPEPEVAPKASQFRPTALSKFEGKRKLSDEERLKQRDAKRQKTRESSNLPEAVLQINQLNQPLFGRKAGPVSLPAPQMTDRELEELARLQKHAFQPGTEEDTATSALLSDYTPTPTPVRGGIGAISRTPARPDTVLLEAQNLIALNSAQTPLLGGENTPLHPSDFGGATPAARVPATPNPLVTPLRGGNPLPGNRGSKSGSGGPMVTPVRDQLNINPRLDELSRIDAQRKDVRSLFSALPQPKNTYQYVLPTDSEDDQDDQRLSSSSLLADQETDQADLDAQQKLREKDEQDRLFRQHSRVLQRTLPRASFLPKASIAGDRTENSPQEMIANELRNLILHDESKYPTTALSRSIPKNQMPAFEGFSDDLIAEARNLLAQERTEILSENGIKPDQFGEFLKEFSAQWERVHSGDEFLFSPTFKRYVEVDSLSSEEIVEALRAQWEMMLARVGTVSNKTKKLQSKISLYNRGYEQRSATLQTQIGQLYSDLELTEIELACFRRLEEKEKYSIDSRLTCALGELKIEQQREAELQQRFDLAQSKLRLLQSRSK